MLSVALLLLLPVLGYGRVIRYDDFDDRQSAYKNPGGAADFRLTEDKWNRTDLTWFYKSTFSPALIREHMQAAMKTWASVTPLKFREVDSESAADIVVEMGGKNHPPCKRNFPENILAHAFFPNLLVRIGGDVHFNLDVHWTFSTDEVNIDFQSVALHEIGHSLGLEHSPDEGAIMYEDYPGGLHRNLQPDDIAGIQKLYGRKKDDVPVPVQCRQITRIETIKKDCNCLNCAWDLHGCLGCNAAGQGQICRFCGFGNFPSCDEILPTLGECKLWPQLI